MVCERWDGRQRQPLGVRQGRLERLRVEDFVLAMRTSVTCVAGVSTVTDSLSLKPAIELLNASMKILAAWALLTLPLWAGQSLRLNGTQTATNNSVAAQAVNAPCRLEFQLSFTPSPTDGNVAHVNACSLTIFQLRLAERIQHHNFRLGLLQQYQRSPASLPTG